MKQNLINSFNRLAEQKAPFLFAINYDGTEAYIRKLVEIIPDECLCDFEGVTNGKTPCQPAPSRCPKWNVRHPKFEDYKKSFYRQC